MTGFSDFDRECMTRALALAGLGMFTTTPHPRVGCVIVRDGAVIGQGFHARAGDAHAEVLALADATARGQDVSGATLYVPRARQMCTAPALYAALEPCNHHGRAPPCVEAILAAGIARVVAAMPDPNPAASDGAAPLRAGRGEGAIRPLAAGAT